MENISNKESEQSSIHSASSHTVSLSSMWDTAGMPIPQSSLSKNLNLRLDSQTLHYHNPKHLGFHPQDQESSSTQSTAQSHHSAAGMEGGIQQGKCASAHSGFEETYGKQDDRQTKSVLSLGTMNFVYPPAHVDFSQSVTHIPYLYTDPHFCGSLATYGQQAIIHPQMFGMAPGRVPLPLRVAEELIYVNAKQYHGILRRRKTRAKLEAQNKLTKRTKPYLHESRHLHAMRRARGSGGRFLESKKLEQSKLSADGDQNITGSALLRLGGSTLESENSSMGGASAACSDITSVSNNDDIFRQVDLGFAGFHPHLGRSLQGSGGSHIIQNGTHHPVSVVQ